MKRYKVIFLLAFTELMQEVSAQSNDQEVVLSQLAKFSKENKQYIVAREKLTQICNTLVSSNGYYWTYALAKSHVFLRDNSSSNNPDSLPANVLYRIHAESGAPFIQVGFPKIENTDRWDNNVIDMQTDLLIWSFANNEEIRPFVYTAETSEETSSKFTLVEFIGNLEYHSGLSFGNTIFLEKGLLSVKDVTNLISYFTDIHKKIKLNTFNRDNNIVALFLGDHSLLTGLFTMKNGNLVGRFEKVSGASNVAAIIVKGAMENKNAKETYFISNSDKITYNDIQKELSSKKVTLKYLHTYTNPPAITFKEEKYNLEIKWKNGNQPKKYTKVTKAEMSKLLEDNGIDCKVNELCMQRKPHVDITVECGAGKNTVSLKISSEAKMEFTMNTDDISNGISIDKDGKLKITHSYE